MRLLSVVVGLTSRDNGLSPDAGSGSVGGVSAVSDGKPRNIQFFQQLINLVDARPGADSVGDSLSNDGCSDCSCSTHSHWKFKRLQVGVEFFPAAHFAELLALIGKFDAPQIQTPLVVERSVAASAEIDPETSIVQYNFILAGDAVHRSTMSEERMRPEEKQIRFCAGVGCSSMYTIHCNGVF